MCFGAVGDAIGDAFAGVDKAANSINPFKGITDWGTENTLAKIPGVGKPLGQLADWGDSHPAEVGAGIGAGWAAAAYLGAGSAAAAEGGAGAAEGTDAVLTADAAADAGAAGAASTLPADVAVGTTGAGGATAAAAGGAASTTPGWLSAAGTAAKYVAPAVVSSLLAPKPPKTKAPTAMPDPLAEQQAAQQKVIQQLARRGRSSTILTNPGSSGGSLGG